MRNGPSFRGQHFSVKPRFLRCIRLTAENPMRTVAAVAVAVAVAAVAVAAVAVILIVVTIVVVVVNRLALSMLLMILLFILAQLESNICKHVCDRSTPPSLYWP